MNAFDHKKLVGLLATYRDLGETQRGIVDQHIQDCPDCAARLAAYRSADRALARLTDPRPGTHLRDEFHAAIRAREQRPIWLHWSGLVGRAVEFAVVILLIVGLSFTLRGRMNSSDAPPGAPASDRTQSAATSLDGQPMSETGAGEETVEKTHRPEEVKSGYLTGSVTLDASPLVSSTAMSGPGSSALSRASFAPQPDVAKQEDGRIYIVQADDTLWKLAEKYLWDGNRYGEIIEATHAKRAEDPSFALIEDPDRIETGSKLWIPAAGAIRATQTPLPGKTPQAGSEAYKRPPPAAQGPGGHIAFSFWNSSPARCTYEINVIDVAACLSGPDACQAARRIFPLNNVSEPALSPGGDRLGFRGWGDPPSEDSPYLDCAPPLKARYLANTTLDGTELRGTGGFWEDAHPDWSPDGGQILFDSQRQSDRISRILLINADGSDERDLRIAGQHPSWASDGQRFVYRGCDLTGNRCGLWLAFAAPVMSWDTGANIIAPLVIDDQAAHPDWSPVSDQIVYQSPRGGSWDLYVVNAAEATDPADARQLTDDPNIEGLPSWSPDGQWIAYLSDAGGNWGIWIIRADGSGRQLLFPFDGGIFTPPEPVEPYGQRDWIDEQISWSK